ncbi:MAG: hypothetical protein WBM11_03430, partial [Terriglobales bacterium]
MKCYRKQGLILLLLVVSSGLMSGQQGTQPAASVPQLMSFSGQAIGIGGRPITGVAGVTFAIYREQYNGSPLWLE